MEGLDEGFFNKLFWLFFILTGFLVVLGLASRVYFLDILLGVMLIAMGLNKLEIEMKHNRSERERMNTEHRIRSLDNMVSDTHSSLTGIRSSHELRVHKLDTKRVDQEKKIEANYRDLVRKIFNMENKMNVIAKAIRDAPELMEVKPRSGRKRKVAKAVKAKTVRAKAAAKKRKR